MVVVVKKPGINIALAQRSLNSGQVHGQAFILNYLAGLREEAGGLGLFWHSRIVIRFFNSSLDTPPIRITLSRLFLPETW